MSVPGAETKIKLVFFFVQSLRHTKNSTENSNTEIESFSERKVQRPPSDNREQVFQHVIFVSAEELIPDVRMIRNDREYHSN